MENLHKILVALVLVALGLSLASFFKPATGTAQDVDALDKIRTDGKMDVCYISFLPVSYKNLKTGELEGISVDLIEKIAEKMNVKINYVETTWGNVVLDLQSKRCQVNISSVFPLIERATGGVMFTEPYGYIGNNAVVKKDDNRFKTLQDLDREDITIAVVEGEASHVYAQQHLTKPELRVISSGDITLAFTEVSAGRADAGLGDAVAIELYLRNHDDVKRLLEKDYLVRESPFTVHEDDLKWLNFLNNAIDGFVVSGELAEIYQKYDFKSITPRTSLN